MEATVSMETLWNQILALSPHDRHRLRHKLDVYEEEKEEKHLTPYTIEELHERIRQSEEDFKVGRYLTEEEANKEMEKFLTTL